jgi:cytochrome b6-f complex iron-sulfur subunit
MSEMFGKHDEQEAPMIVSQPNERLSEADEAVRQRLARRRFLRRSILAVGGLSVVAVGAGALYMMYPALSGQFGSTLDLGPKANFPAATPDMLRLNNAGVFFAETARAFIVHLDKGTHFLLTGGSLEDQLAEEQVTRDPDGSFWLALYWRCVHLGTPVAFRNDCLSFKCPSHGARFHCDGEYLSGPAPRNMDRFPLSFSGEHVLIDTGRLLHVSRSSDESWSGTLPRLLPIPQVGCE